jgi:hypothetical protein
MVQDSAVQCSTQHTGHESYSAALCNVLHCYSGIDHLGDVSEDNVLPVEMWCLLSANEELI